MEINMRKILLGSLAVLALAACSNEENNHAESGNGRATFTASIDGRTATRAFDQSWESGDAIGITGKSGEIPYSNVKYATTGDGNFTVATQGQEIYYEDDNEVSFTAYYPWNASTTITANTLEQSKQKTFDFLHATGKGSKVQPNVAFKFYHKMAKVVLTVKKGDDVSFSEVKAALPTLGGFLAEGTFDGLTGKTSVTGTQTATLVFADNAPTKENAEDETVSYTLILFPQEFSGKLPFSAELEGMQTFSAALDFTAANATIDKDAAKNAWVAGRQYNLSVTLHKTKLTVDGCTIAPWNEADGGNFDAE